MSLLQNQNTQAIQAWDKNAEFWDERMGEGNDFFNVLLWRAVEKLLKPRRGERLLDVACGNGVMSRRLANAEASVTAFDGSPAMIALASARGGPSNIDYHVIDATHYEALIDLGAGAFDAALCNMALMDMADIDPLMNALSRPAEARRSVRIFGPAPLLQQSRERPNGRTGRSECTLVTTYSVKIALYQTAFTRVGLAMHGQPVPHPYFHRPLGLLLAPALAAGLMLDGFEERAFPPENVGGTIPLSWNGRFSEIPAALVYGAPRELVPQRRQSHYRGARSLVAK